MIDTYERFEDIKDSNLKARNRAIVMANIFEDNNKGEDITKEGAALLFGYFKSLPKVYLALTFEAFKSDMANRGYAYGG